MKRVTMGIRVFYCVVWLCGIGVVGTVGYDVIAPVARTVSTTLQNVLVDNPGLHN
ncbi:hypothetical protein [Burkholderia pseudomallei]|uniref:hypothetical protein n=1 Tax=Burkholderia pseudomallei TaxID=28450 RepID=UPI00190D437F|nr:hypothetical protein [Burkholderia pseudomallei]